MRILIENYMLLSREERRNHLQLYESCIEIGGYSTNFSGLLAYHLNTTIPSGKKIHLCHACHNGKCSNVNHLYWGSNKDNHQDARENGSHLGIYENSKRKYGEEVWLNMQRNFSKLGSEKADFRSRKWHTNGIQNKRIKIGDIPPEGFVKGFTIKSSRNSTG